MRIKQFIVKAHLLLGLISGTGVFIIALTGALYAFKTEIESFTQSYKRVDVENKELLLPSKAIRIAKEAKPGIAVHGVLYQTPTDALEVIYYQPEPFYYGAAYINPYSGEVIKEKNYLRTFFGFILRGHTTLWLPFKIGYPVVAIVCLIFLIMLITGIVLWWPRKNSSSKSFSFTKKKASIQRLEIHKVVGFYVSFFALLIALTGLTWLLRGLDRAIYKAMGGKKDIVYSLPLSDTTQINAVQFDGEPVDELFRRIKKQNPDIPFIEVHAVENDSSSVLIELNSEPSKYRKMDFLYFDQYTLERIETNNIYGSFEDAEIPDKIKRSYYDIHTGSILGLPGKFLAFFASLFCASLPITGFILWWNRRREKKAFLQKMEI